MGNGSDDLDVPVAETGEAGEAGEVDEVAVAVLVFQMLSDATRVQLLRALSSRPHELSVNELAKAVGKHPATVSQHLAKLRMVRLVTTRQQGNQVFYRVANEHVSALVTDALRHTEHLGHSTPKHHQAGAPGPH